MLLIMFLVSRRDPKERTVTDRRYLHPSYRTSPGDKLGSWIRERALIEHAEYMDELVGQMKRDHREEVNRIYMQARRDALDLMRKVLSEQAFQDFVTRRA
jgi:hypothetical protein